MYEPWYLGELPRTRDAVERSRADSGKRVFIAMSHMAISFTSIREEYSRCLRVVLGTCREDPVIFRLLMERVLLRV